MKIQWKVNQHWLRIWRGTDQATRHHMYQIWPFQTAISRQCHAQVINGSLHVRSIIESVQKDQMNNKSALVQEMGGWVGGGVGGGWGWGWGGGGVGGWGVGWGWGVGDYSITSQGPWPGGTKISTSVLKNHTKYPYLMINHIVNSDHEYSSTTLPLYKR